MQVDHSRLDQLRNSVAYAQLGQGICRGQAAVTHTVCWWESDRALTAGDVVVDMDKYAVGFALKHSKNDPFHDNAKKDDGQRRDWIWCAGCPGSQLDIVPLVSEYRTAMGFDGMTTAQLERAPFYQEVSLPKKIRSGGGFGNGTIVVTPEKLREKAGNCKTVQGRPTGRPLTYKRLLEEWRTDLDRLSKLKYPVLNSSEWGLHSWRRYGATVAKMNGVQNDIIRRLGRWRSDCFELYFALTIDDEIDMQAQLLQGTPVGGAQRLRPAGSPGVLLAEHNVGGRKKVPLRVQGSGVVPETLAQDGRKPGRHAGLRQREGRRGRNEKEGLRGELQGDGDQPARGQLGMVKVSGVNVPVRARGHRPRTKTHAKTRTGNC
jgi:hypothetical protein